MKILFMWKLAAVVVSVFLSAISTMAIADTIDPAGAIKVLIGKTWAGTNDQGSDYWFWHDQGTRSGKFAAKFNGPSKGISIHHGTWEIEGDGICWHWPDWGKKYCYVKFERAEGKLEMTRSDGEVHAGTLVDGNTEGL